MRSTVRYFIYAAAVLATPTYAAEPQHQHHETLPSATPLTAPGNDAFAAIQEITDTLLADPKTDWSRVNLEPLRQHLVDMRNFTLNVNVSAQKPIEGGMEFTVKAVTPEASASLGRLLSAHPAILKQETGWEMTAAKTEGGGYTARVTSTVPGDAAKIRGLGYIGIVALGKHHQAHHWQMATGAAPHQH